MLIAQLSPKKRYIANSILSAYAFYYMVGDALVSNKPLSVVRMGDGERTLLEECLSGGMRPDTPVTSYDPAWHTRLGIAGIDQVELYKRILEAGNTCSHFAPSVSGLVQRSYDLFDYFEHRDQYVDNFFVNIWDNQYKADLFKTAGEVLFIHRNRGTADAMQINAKRHFGVKVRYLELSNWDQADSVVEAACSDKARLVLFAGGPASKCISPRIAASNKVVLDIGNSTDYWTFANYQPN